MQKISLCQFRRNPGTIRKRVQFKGQSFAIAHHQGIVGYLIPVEKLEGLAIATTEDVPICQLKERVTQIWEKLQMGVDCVYFTYHRRRAIAFVAAKYFEYQEQEVG